MLLRWPKKTESQTRPDSQRARQPEPDRETDRADRADRPDRFPARQDGRPPGGLGRPARGVSINGKDGAPLCAAERVRPYVNPVRDSLGGIGRG